MTDIESTVIVNTLDGMTVSLGESQILSELQTIIERVSFSKLHQNSQVRGPISTAEIDLLFDGQISPEMLFFTHWLSEHKLLRVVTDDAGVAFFSYCVKYYRNIREITFTSATILTRQLQDSIRKQLANRYDTAIRIIFEISPSIIAGFIIDDGTAHIDRSLRTFSNRHMPTYLSNLVSDGVTAHE